MQDRYVSTDLDERHSVCAMLLLLLALLCLWRHFVLNHGLVDIGANWQIRFLIYADFLTIREWVLELKLPFITGQQSGAGTHHVDGERELLTVEDERVPIVIQLVLHEGCLLIQHVTFLCEKLHAFRHVMQVKHTNFVNGIKPATLFQIGLIDIVDLVFEVNYR